MPEFDRDDDGVIHDHVMATDDARGEVRIAVMGANPKDEEDTLYVSISSMGLRVSFHMERGNARGLANLLRAASKTESK